MKNYFKFIICLLVSIRSVAYAEIITDGSVGAAQTLAGTQFEIPQSLGTTVGQNLFHSFSQFNLQADESATFSGDASLKNVISRVTGGSPSWIDGVLRSTVGNAHFYFINPAGITLGSNAQVDVPAAFHLSTADAVRFINGDSFNAQISAKSVLSIAEPSGFGFLNNQGTIQLQAQLVFKPNTFVSFSSNALALDNAQLTAESGTLQLYTTGTANAELDLRTQTNSVLAGEIQMSNSHLMVSGNGAGRMALRSGSISLNDSTLQADNSGDIPADLEKGIDISATRLQLGEGSTIHSDVFERGSGGNIAIQSGNILIQGSNNSAVETGIFSTTGTSATGHAGNINLQTEFLSLQNAATISTATYAEGNAGNITIHATRLEADGNGVGANITSHAASVSTGAFAKAGNIDIHSQTMSLVHDAQLSSFVSSQADAGYINVTADSLLIDGQLGLAGIFSTNTNNAWTNDVAGNAGAINLNVANLTVLNQGQINAQTWNLGHAGDINIQAKNVLLDAGGQKTNSTGIFSDAAEFSSGKASQIAIQTDNLSVLNGAKISSDTASTGDAGTIHIEAQTLVVDGKGIQTKISSEALPTSEGQAGTVTVNAKQIALLNAGTISSSTKGLNHAGDVAVTAQTLDINGVDSPLYTGIFSDAYKTSSGNAGTVSVTANALNLRNSGQISTSIWATGHAGIVEIKSQHVNLATAGKISSSAFAQGRAGNVLIDTGYLAMNGQDTGIFSAAETSSGGQTGSLFVKASQAINLLNQAKISMQNDATVLYPQLIIPTSITVSAPNIDLKNSLITTQSTGNVNAGDITVNFSRWLSLDPSFITTASNIGNGGIINIQGGQGILLQDSGFLTSASGANSNGGNINLTTDVLVMNTGVIQANAVGGTGGDIGLNLKALIPSQNQLIKGGKQVNWLPFVTGLNVIQAASANGISGEINLTAPQFDISGSVSGLNSAALVLPQVERSSCQGAFSNVSSLARNGKGGMPLSERESGFIPLQSSAQLPVKPLTYSTSPLANLSVGSLRTCPSFSP